MRKEYAVFLRNLFGPGSFTPAERPAELAKEELSLNGTAFWSLWLQGALHYRAGRSRDALTLLQKSRDDKSNLPDGVAATGMWLALTYHRLNQPKEARREFEQAEKWLPRCPTDSRPPPRCSGSGCTCTIGSSFRS